MKLLLYCEVREGLQIPRFGAAFEAHIASKRHPQVRASSLTAWRLLEIALRKSGVDALPGVAFEGGGRPVFASHPLYFSLSHSGGIAAAILSDAPCAVDAEAVRPETAARLYERCLTQREKEKNIPFFECWTRKECIGKLGGRGMPAHPSELDSLDTAYDGCFHTREITDRAGQAYILTALCTGGGELQVQKIEPEEL